MLPESDDYRPPPWKTKLIVVCVILYVAGCWVQACVPERQPDPPKPASSATEAPPESWATDTLDAGIIARPMPAKPFEGQKRPPCAKDEAAFDGACWMELVRRPETDNCGSKGFEHEGRCYVPVRQAQRPPTSLGP